MDENLTDNERVEQLRIWWRENAWFLIGGVALGALVLFGWNQYTAYRDHRAEEAGTLYQTVKQATDAKDVVQATTVLAHMRSEFPSSAYTSQAGLLVAGTLVVSAPERATEELKYVMDKSGDAELAMIARLRLARVLAYREKYDDALQTLAVPKPGKFAGRIAEVKGDIQAARGNVDAARVAYLEAMVADGSELLDRNFLQMKLNDLPGGGGSSPEVAVPPPGGTAAPGAAPAASAPPAAAAPATGEGA